jgi:hypothetical protein
MTPDQIVVSIIGVLVLFVIGVLRVERKPKITLGDMSDAWLRGQGWVLRAHQAILWRIDPALAHRRSRRVHEDATRRIRRAKNPAVH